MKVLQINKFFYRKGGSETAMFAEADQLRAHGHEVVEFSMAHPRNEPSRYSSYFIDEIDFNRSEGLFKNLKKAAHLIYSFEARRKLEKLIKDTQPDVAHIHNLHYQLTPSVLAVLRARNIPVVWTLHDYKLLCPNAELYTQGSTCERCKTRRYYNAFLFRCIKNSFAKSFLAMIEAYLHASVLRSYRSVATFICPSEFLATKIVEWNIDPKKVVHLYNSVPAVRDEQHLGSYALYLGRLSHVKGVETLLNAFLQKPSRRLKIVGDGPLRDYVTQFIHSHNMKNVEYLGYQQPDSIRRLLDESRFIVAPSVWYENNPLSILEAFSYGKPAIGSRIGGIPELIGADERGILVEPYSPDELAEQAERLFSDDGLTTRLGAAARSFVSESLDPEAHYRRLAAIYTASLSK